MKSKRSLALLIYIKTKIIKILFLLSAKKYTKTFFSNLLLILFERNIIILKFYYFFYHLFSPKGLRLLKFKTVNSLNNSKFYTEIFEADKSISVSRRDIKGNGKRILYNIPGIGYYLLRNVKVNPLTPCFEFQNVMYRPKLLVDELANYKNQFVVEHNLKYTIIGSLREENINEGIFLSGSWPTNWFHWLIEIVPKLMLLKYLPEKYRKYPLLIPGKIKESKNHIDLIRLLGVENKIFYLDINYYYKIEFGIILESIVLGPPRTYKNGKNTTYPSAYFHNKILKEYRNILLKHENENRFLQKRIFLGRKIPGREYNQEEIFKFFKQFGFQIIFTERLSVVEQINLFKNAELIVGPTGAHWANIIFASNKCKALCWEPNIEFVNQFYSNLAELSNVDLRFVKFETQYNTWEEFKNSGSYFLDIEFIKKTSSFLFN